MENEESVCSLSREEIIELAATAFPEYSAKITSFYQSTPTALSQNNIEDTVVVHESRALSDSMSIVYQENSSGQAFIYAITCGKVNSTSTSYGAYTDYSVDLHAVCTFSTDSFLINDFRHRCTSNLVDSILSFGTLDGTVISCAYDAFLQYESGSSEPYACYVATFRTSHYFEGLYDAYITVSIEDGVLSIYGR